MLTQERVQELEERLRCAPRAGSRSGTSTSGDAAPGGTADSGGAAGGGIGARPGSRPTSPGSLAASPSAASLLLPLPGEGDVGGGGAAALLHQRMAALKASRDKLIAALDAQAAEVERLGTENAALAEVGRGGGGGWLRRLLEGGRAVVGVWGRGWELASKACTCAHQDAIARSQCARPPIRMAGLWSCIFSRLEGGRSVSNIAASGFYVGCFHHLRPCPVPRCAWLRALQSRGKVAAKWEALKPEP